MLQAYYREGVALQCLGKHSEALAAFSAGLAQDPKSLQLLAGLVEAAMKSPLKGEQLNDFWVFLLRVIVAFFYGPLRKVKNFLEEYISDRSKLSCLFCFPG